MSDKSGKAEQVTDVAQSKKSSKTLSQRETRAGSKDAAAASDNDGTTSAAMNGRRATKSVKRRNSAATSNASVRILATRDIAARASASGDNEDLRRTIAGRSLKRNFESQTSDVQPAKRMARVEQRSEMKITPQRTSHKERRKRPVDPHTCCSCVDHQRLELARAAGVFDDPEQPIAKLNRVHIELNRAADAFNDHEQQIADLNAEAEQYERQVIQKDDYIQRLLQRLGNTKKSVLCTADWDLLNILDVSNKRLLEKHEEWRKILEARTMYEIVKPVDVALQGECEELSRRLKLAGEKLQLLEQERGASWPTQANSQ